MTTKEEQKIIIERLIDTLKISMLNNLEKFPESWNDMEIRSYLNHKAMQLNYIKMTRTRMRNYKDYVEKYKM